MCCHDNSHVTWEGVWSRDLHSKLVHVSEEYHQSEMDGAHGLGPQVLAILTGVNERV